MLLDVSGFIASLGLPGGCRVDQRVPKKLLLENGAPTAADKRLIADAVEEISGSRRSSRTPSACLTTETSCASTWRSRCLP